MLRSVEMLGRVLVLRRVAAAHMSAGETQAQMNPGVARFHTIFAHMLVRFLDFDLVQVRTFLRHWFLRKKILVRGQVTTVM